MADLDLNALGDRLISKSERRGIGFGVHFDVEQLSRDLDAAAKKQLPFGLALALNRTMEEAQQNVWDRMRMRGLRIRSAQSDAWLMRQVKFFRGDRAQKDKLEVALTINPGAGSGGRETGSFTGRSILAFLEEGGDRVGLRPIGDGSVFGPSVVIPVRSSPLEQVAKNLFPINLGLQPRRKIEGGLGGATLKGKRRAFAIRTASGKGIVLQRFGPGQRDTRALFFIRPKVRVQGRHYATPTVERTFAERLPINFASFFKYALDTAK